ncbi:hypothetical protein [Rhizobium tubonense]|uniref:PRC-barrel domain-containing protein n=1 Tax=Rhizobium tubonense TaxID=484088 RepID=A0A2W4F372_9HYPH|nr:hypothetical protein [Rhizobium tubonense]PZM16413.1 hypothetical protein CPY51_03440 [Rhizobium tubonense]
MDLVRDVLDKQLVDRNGVKMGKVDSILAELRPDRPPRIIGIEIGSIAMARRLGPWPERWTRRMATKLGGVKHSEPHRFLWSEVKEVRLNVELKVDVRETDVFDWQDWLRDRLIGRIPGA